MISAGYRGGAMAAESVAEGAPPISAPALYTNPRVRFDRDAAILVIEIRDVQSGEVQRSIPDRSILEAYRRAALTGSAVPGQYADQEEPPLPGRDSAQTDRNAPAAIAATTGTNRAEPRSSQPTAPAATVNPASTAAPASAPAAGAGPTIGAPTAAPVRTAARGA
jgi:hypothetical protein